MATKLLQLETCTESESENEKCEENEVEIMELNESSSNEYHSDDEKQIEIISDDEEEEEEIVSNKRVFSISVDIESLIKDRSINCDFPSIEKEQNNQQKPIIFGDHFQHIHRRYFPSTFQAAILWHIDWQRRLNGHRIGLTVMATACGKTICCILDIEKELNAIHSTIGTQYGINCKMRTAQKSKKQWTNTK